MIKVVIVDDEEIAVLTLLKFLKDYCPNVEVTHSTTDPEEAIQFIESTRPDLVFVDIEMPIINGFDLLSQVKHAIKDAIFVTAFSEYALPAFKAGILDYILKPINPTELINAVHKAAEKIHKEQRNEALHKFLSELNTAPKIQNLQPQLQFQVGDGILYIKADDVLYLESANSFSFLYTKNEPRKIISQRLGDIEETLPVPPFFRLHRQYVVNMQHIVKYVKGRGGYVVMGDGKNIDVSVRRKEEFLQMNAEWKKDADRF
jgi:two-component system, LytTR family, response regulator